MRRSSWTSFVISILLLAARLGQTTSGHKLRCQDSGQLPQLAEPPRHQSRKMTGGLRSKTRSSIHSSSGPPNKTWTSSWLSNVYRKLEQHEASLVRVIFFPSTERPRPPAIAKESSCQPGRRNLPSSSQSNTTIFRAALPPHGNWMSSEEFVGACKLPLPT